MIRIPGPIPILIRPMFWVLAALIGFISGGGGLLSTVVWMGVIFVSVLFHEMGHACTALLFKRKPRIELVAMGGLTYHDGQELSLWKQFLIVLNGPLFGLMLAIGATFLLPFIKPGNLSSIVRLFQFINFFWTAINLLPVIPLDGGQLMRILLEKFCGVRGIHHALLVSACVSLVIGLLGFLFQNFFIGALFFLFAYQGYEGWKQSRTIAEPDQKEALKKELERAEKAFESGNKEEAALLFEKIRKETGRGMLYVFATQYLAFLDFEKGKIKEAYALLLSIRSQLSGEALCLLHRLAFEFREYSLVAELSGSCFQILPNAEVALRNAFACAALSQITPAVGWLKTAQQEGLQNLAEITRETAFDPIRSDPTFQEFLKTL